MKIVVDVVNSEKVKDLTAEIQRQEKQILSWNAAMKGASATQQAVLQTNMANAGKTIANARTEIASLEAATGGAGRGLSQLSYAIDDVQYGFNAIVNNIPQIIMGLGGSAGLAGAVGIAAVAVNQLIKHWSEFTALIEAGFSNQSYDQLVALKEAAENAAKSYEKLAKAKTEWEDKSAKEVSKVIANAGADKLRTVIAGVLGAEGEGAEMTDDERKAIESVKNAKPEVRKGVEERVQKRLQEANAKEAEKIIGGLTAGGETEQKARSRLQHLIDNNPQPFDQLHPDFRTEFAATHPDKIEEKKKAEDFEKAEKKIQEKEDQINKQRWHERRQQLQEEKNLRIQGIEDERTAVHDAQRTFDEEMWKKQHMTRPNQIIEGAKGFVDYIQKAAGGDNAKELAKQAHEQRVKTNKELAEINKKLEKERRLVIPN